MLFSGVGECEWDFAGRKIFYEENMHLYGIGIDIWLYYFS